MGLASRQFVQKQFPATLQALSQALYVCAAELEEPAWYEERWNVPLDPFRDLKRRVIILLITFYATTWSTPPAAAPAAAKPGHESLHPILKSLEAASSTSSGDGRLNLLVEAAVNLHPVNGKSPSSSARPMPMSSVQYLPPSVAVALLLAGLKVKATKQKLQLLTDSWMAGIPESMLSGLRKEGEATQAQSQNQAALLASVPSLDSSFLAGGTSRPYLAELLRGYHKMVETYGLIILPSEQLFREAHDWLDRQQEGNSRGVLPAATVLVRTTSVQLCKLSRSCCFFVQALQDKLAHLQTQAATATEREKEVAQQQSVRRQTASERSGIKHEYTKTAEPSKGQSEGRHSSASSSSASASSSPTSESRQRDREETGSRRVITVHNGDQQAQGFWARLHQSTFRPFDSATSSILDQPRSPSAMLSVLAKMMTPQLFQYALTLLLAWYLFRRSGRNRMRFWLQRIAQTVRLGVKTTSL